MSQDHEIVAEFLVESHENVERMERELIALERNPDDAATVASIFRSIHTLKGTCGFLGYPRLETLAHAGESLLSLLRDEELSYGPPIAEGLLALIDAVKGMLANIEAHGFDGDDDHAGLLQRLGDLSRGAPAPAPARAAADPAPAPAPARAAAAAPPAPVHAHADTSVRVDVALLDKLMTLTGELILARNQAMQQLAGTPVPASFGATAQRLHALSTALQENVMKTRMLPIGNIFAKLPRVVRDVATALGKDVRTELDGEGTELDRTLIEAIKDPLTHLVRNAIDHGVEDPATRRARGKPAQGTVSLRAYHAGGQVNVEIADDGNGIDCEKIRKKAVALGTLSAEAARDASERELLPLIFAPGFSTAERVTSVSGRGVGLDVVKTHIERIGGMVDVKTSAGKGTTIHLRIPLTLAIVPSLIVSSAGARFAIPQANLVELVRAPALRMESFHGVSVYRLRGRLLPLVVLSSVLGERAAPAGDTVNIVVLQTRERPFGLVVDEIHDTDDIVVKPLGAHFRGIAAFSGATILGDGDVALILDVAAVAAAGGAVGEIVEGAGRAAPAVVSASEESLLLCRSAGDGVVAIRLGAVRRLDRIPVASIERTGDEEVVQYHGEIMPLRRLSALLGDASVADDDDKLDVVVIGSIGVVVSQILDIVHCDATVQRRSTRLGVVGSLVVNGRVTELLDVGALLQTSGLRLAAPAVAA